MIARDDEFVSSTYLTPLSHSLRLPKSLRRVASQPLLELMRIAETSGTPQ